MDVAETSQPGVDVDACMCLHHPVMSRQSAPFTFPTFSRQQLETTSTAPYPHHHRPAERRVNEVSPRCRQKTTCPVPTVPDKKKGDAQVRGVPPPRPLSAPRRDRRLGQISRHQGGNKGPCPQSPQSPQSLPRAMPSPSRLQVAARSLLSTEASSCCNLCSVVRIAVMQRSRWQRRLPDSPTPK